MDTKTLEFYDPMKLSEESQQFVDTLKEGNIPEKFPFAKKRMINVGIEELIDHAKLKDICNGYGMWAIVDQTWTKDLATWIGERSVLEVMAGSGWLAKALDMHGIKIRATDNFSWDSAHKSTRVFAIDNADAVQAASGSTEEVLIISWPPYEGKEIIDVCLAWGSERPIIYIGEEVNGCNAPKEFFDNFIEEDVHIPNPQFRGVHDNVRIGYWNKQKANDV